MPRCRAAGALVLVLLVAGCGGESGSASDTGGPTSADTAASTSAPVTTEPTGTPTDGEPTSPATSKEPKRPTGAAITTGESPFGTMLFDANDQAIYIWELEPTAEPTCYGDCAVTWPPVLTEGRPVARGEVRDGLLGTTERRDGSMQVTYNDHPLYYYVDEPPGAVECHDISTHGGLWWVIQPDGDRAA